MVARFAPALLAAFGMAAHAAAGIVPPLPRVPASALEPAGEPDDPMKLVDRIAQNTKAAGDRLKQNDAGEGTRKTQDQILKDIDELLKQAQNPPPMSSGGGGGGGQSDQNSGSGGGQSGENSAGNPNGGGPVQNKKPSGGSGKPQAGRSQAGSEGEANGKPSEQAGGKSSRSARRERRQGTGTAGREPGGKEPQGGATTGNATAGGTAGPPKPAGDGGMSGTSVPSLPLDDAITKQVWGHLPERLRQQMTQYYREQFVSKYGDLLRDYYSSLAEREKSPKKP